MIQKRNISTFAIGLCLLAFMLLSASPAKAFKTTDPNMTIHFDMCLKKDYQGNARLAKKCFKDFRTKYMNACLVEGRLAKYSSRISMYCG